MRTERLKLLTGLVALLTAVVTFTMEVAKLLQA